MSGIFYRPKKSGTRCQRHHIFIEHIPTKHRFDPGGVVPPPTPPASINIETLRVMERNRHKNTIDVKPNNQSNRRNKNPDARGITSVYKKTGIAKSFDPGGVVHPPASPASINIETLLDFKIRITFLSTFKSPTFNT